MVIIPNENIKVMLSDTSVYQSSRSNPKIGSEWECHGIIEQIIAGNIAITKYLINNQITDFVIAKNVLRAPSIFIENLLQMNVGVIPITADVRWSNGARNSYHNKDLIYKETTIKNKGINIKKYKSIW